MRSAPIQGVIVTRNDPVHVSGGPAGTVTSSTTSNGSHEHETGVIVGTLGEIRMSSSDHAHPGPTQKNRNR